jgi:predicted metal-dependent peptidase
VTDVQRYSRERPFKSTQPLQIKGGGGTDFKGVFEYLKKEKITPKVLIYYTDGEGALPPKAPPYPVLWMLSREQNMPWGKKIVISEN